VFTTVRFLAGLGGTPLSDMFVCFAGLLHATVKPGKDQPSALSEAGTPSKLGLFVLARTRSLKLISRQTSGL
jgi:hypothetical protein